MGFHVTPRGETKETWLEREGKIVPAEEVHNWIKHDEYFPVALTTSGNKSMSDIITCEAELDDLCNVYLGERRTWYIVRRERLAPFMPGMDRVDD